MNSEAQLDQNKENKATDNVKASAHEALISEANHASSKMTEAVIGSASKGVLEGAAKGLSHCGNELSKTGNDLKSILPGLDIHDGAGTAKGGEGHSKQGNDSTSGSAEKNRGPVDGVKNPGPIIVDGVKNPVDAVKNPVDAVKNTVDAVKNTVDAVKNTVDAVKNPVDAMKNPVDAMKNPVDAMKNPVDAVKNPVDAVKNPVDAVKNPVDGVKNPGPVDGVKNPGPVDGVKNPGPIIVDGVKNADKTVDPFEQMRNEVQARMQQERDENADKIVESIIKDGKLPANMDDMLRDFQPMLFAGFHGDPVGLSKYIDQINEKLKGSGYSLDLESVRQKGHSDVYTSWTNNVISLKNDKGEIKDQRTVVTDPIAKPGISF